MNKRASTELYEKVLHNTLAAGINCSCYLIFGFPGETEASAERTIAFMKQFDNASYDGTIAWSIFPFVLAPLSPIYEPEARKKIRTRRASSQLAAQHHEFRSGIKPGPESLLRHREFGRHLSNRQSGTTAPNAGSTSQRLFPDPA